MTSLYIWYNLTPIHDLPAASAICFWNNRQNSLSCGVKLALYGHNRTQNEGTIALQTADSGVTEVRLVQLSVSWLNRRCWPVYSHVSSLCAFPSTYAVRRIRDAFRENKALTDGAKIENELAYGQSNLEIIKRQVSTAAALFVMCWKSGGVIRAGGEIVL